MVAGLFLLAVTIISSPILSPAQQTDPELSSPQDPASAQQDIDTLLRRDSGHLLLGMTALVLGLSALILTLLRTESRDAAVTLFGVLSLIWGLRFLFRTFAVPYLVGGDPAEWGLITRFLAYLSAPAAFAFTCRIFGPGWRHTIRWVTGASLVFALVASSLLFINRDPDGLIHVFNVLVIGGVVVIIGNLVRPEHRQAPETRRLVIGGIGCTVFIILENLDSLGLISLPFSVEWIGVLILYGTLAHVTVLRLLGLEQHLAALRQELETARQIQASILPRRSPSTPGLDVATRHLPMTEVAGDFYDFVLIGEKKQGLLIADVSGHGVPAALIASMVKVAFMAQAGHLDSPERTLSGLNRILGHRMEGQFVTAGYVCIDLEDQTLRYAGAGHPPLMIRSGTSGRADLLAPNGLILGPFPDAQYHGEDRPLETGDRIVMYTDGVVDAEDAAGEPYGEQRLVRLLEQSNARTADDFAGLVLSAIKDWSAVGRGRALDDDLTLIVADVG